MKVQIELEGASLTFDTISFGGADIGQTGPSAVGVQQKLDVQVGQVIKVWDDFVEAEGVVTSVSHEPRTALTAKNAWATIMSFKKTAVRQLEPKEDPFANQTGEGALSILQSIANRLPKGGPVERRDTIVIEEPKETLPEDDIDLTQELNNDD